MPGPCLVPSPRSRGLSFSGRSVGITKSSLQGKHFFQMAIIYINAMYMTYVTRVTHDHLHSIIHPVPLYDILDIRNIYMCYWQAQHESWELVAEEKTLYGQVESSLSSSLPSSSSSSLLPSSSSSSTLPSSSSSTSRWRRQ